MRKLIEKHQQKNGRGRGVILLSPRAYILSLLNFMPGMDTTSNISVQQANQQARLLEEVKRDNPKTRAEGSYRNIERRRKSGKTKDQEDTERDIKLATLPTWKTEAADAAHYIGTGLSAVGGGLALLSNPVTMGTALAGGMIGGRAVDKASQRLTGKTWAENIQEKLGLQTPTLAEFTNPGYFIGGGLGLKGKGALDYLIKADMPRFGYSPNTQYYFKPGYAGINNFNIVSQNPDERMSIPLMSLIRNLRGTYNNSDIMNVINRLNRNGYLELSFEDGATNIVGTRRNLLDLQNDLNGKLPSGSRVNLVQTESNLLSQPRPLGIIIDERAMNSNAPRGRTRSAEEVQRHGRYKIEDIIDSNGNLKVNPNGFSSVETGAHGNFINIGGKSSPEEVFENLVDLYNSSNGKRELSSIMKSNPRGRSGIMIHTHDGDLSTDSHELALAIERSLGETYVPVTIPNNPEFVYANNLGYKNLFTTPDKWKLSLTLRDAINSGIRNVGRERYWSPENLHNYGFTVEKVDKPGLIGSLLIKKGGIDHGYIPALSEEEVLRKGFNDPIEKLNSKFKINIEPAYISTDRFIPKLWTFDKGIYYPNQTGFILKKGGNIILKFKNRKRW